MARIRKSDTSSPQRQQIIWKVGKYIRLSREDGSAVSESVVNQNKILDDEIPGFFKDVQYEVVDAYIDDGTSGTTDIERRDFQRMVQDMKSGRINCVVVKNLSRAFRNSANQGHFLEEFIPLYNTRFISLYQPRIDTFLDPEVVHSLEVSITGFMNEQYAYKTSADVRRTFRHKRERGEFIGAFAPYGYVKDPNNKNAQVIDKDAAQVVRDMFNWFITDGMSKAGIAKRLNELGIPNPTAYKRAKGFHYENPHAKANDGMWNPGTVSRMLQDPLYTGVMRQGRQKVISYKVHRRASVPESEWFVVENAVPPIVGREVFQTAQALHRRDTRTVPGQREGELEKAIGLLDGLYLDWKSGDITHSQHCRMKAKFEEQAGQLQSAVEHIRGECDTITRGIIAEDPYLITFLKYGNIQRLSRGLLVDLVNVIYVHENGEIEIEFNFEDQYRQIADSKKKAKMNTIPPAEKMSRGLRIKHCGRWLQYFMHNCRSALSIPSCR